MTLADQVRERRRIPSPRVARAIRLEAEVTQRAVAKELNVHPVTVARWESGARRPCGPLGQAYAELLRQLSEAAS